MISGFYNPAGDNCMQPGMSGPGERGGDLRFCPVEADGFRGGYYLHDRLPLKDADIYYSDGGQTSLFFFQDIYTTKRNWPQVPA